MDTFLNELAKNGPWAVMCGFLLWQVIKAWTADRALLTVTLVDFGKRVGELAAAVQKLTDRLDAIDQHEQQAHTREPAR